MTVGGSDASTPRGLKLDCRHYRGDRPCQKGVSGFCPSDCRHYSAMGHRILIIKLGALGDVIRTAALLPTLKETWPNSHITWISRPAGVRVLANHPLIDRQLPFTAETLCHVEVERFDLCLSLDKEPAPAALAMRIDAADKRGIGLSPSGTPYPLNSECGPYFELGLDDHTKFHVNHKTYQQLIHEAVGLRYNGQKYRLYPSEQDRAHAERCWESWGITPSDTVIGLNTGSGRVFANKNWSVDRFVELARRLTQHNGWRVAVLGGPDEAERNRHIAAMCPEVVETGTGHSELEFAALIQRCDVVVTGDTMAMHVAIAGDVPCVALFGPTCEQEITLYGHGEKLVTSLPCSPCYRRACERSPSCMDSISTDRVLEAVHTWVAGQPAKRPQPSLPAEVRV